MGFLFWRSDPQGVVDSRRRFGTLRSVTFYAKPPSGKNYQESCGGNVLGAGTKARENEAREAGAPRNGALEVAQSMTLGCAI